MDWLALMNTFRQAAGAQDAAAMADLGRAWGVIEKALEGDVNALTDQIQARREAGRPVTKSNLVTLDRYQSLLTNLSRQVNGFINGPAATTIARSQSVLAGLGASQAQTAIIGAGQGAFTQISRSIIDSVITATRGGSPLSSLLAAAYPEAAQGITDIFISQVVQGINPRVIAQRVIAKGLAKGLNHVLLVSRDQGNRAWRNTAQAQYQRSGVVNEYMRVAARGPRTCVACLALDGAIYKTDQLMPLHPQCRCAIVPIVIGFPPPKIGRGSDWLATQPIDIQREILGPERYDRYKRGMPLDQMIEVGDHPEWGPTVRIAPLTDRQN